MTISVALCTYQGAAWIEALLASIAGQSRPPDELVVSDDGSSDETMRLVEAFAGSAPFPVEISRTEARLGSTMNFARAFARCGGDLVAPADQDDVWAPDKLARLEAEQVATGAGVVFSDGRVIDEHGVPTGARLWPGVGFSGRDQRQFGRDPLAVLLRRSVITGAAMVFDRSVLERALPFPGVLADERNPMLQDRWIALLAAALGPVRAVPEPLIDFREHPGQQTGLRSPLTVDEVRHQAQRGDAAATRSARAAQLRAARERLDGAPRPALDAVDAAIAHLDGRSHLPAARARRLGWVVPEVLSGRYRRFSGGVASAAADLTRPHRG